MPQLHKHLNVTCHFNSEYHIILEGYLAQIPSIHRLEFMFKELKNINTDSLHITLRGIGFGILTFAILCLITPLVFWAEFGEGQYSTEIGNLTITKVLWALSAAILLLPIIAFRFVINYRKRSYSKAKDYLYIALVVLSLSGIIAYFQWS